MPSYKVAETGRIGVEKGASGRAKKQTTFITAVQQVKKQLTDKLDLRDWLELPKTDMRVAILDIQHQFMVEKIEEKKKFAEDELGINTAGSCPYSKALPRRRMGPHVYRFVSCFRWRKVWSRVLLRYVPASMVGGEKWQ
jgi:hypothetical protein